MGVMPHPLFVKVNIIAVSQSYMHKVSTKNLLIDDFSPSQWIVR